MRCCESNRRDFLYGLGLSLGSAAMASLLQAEEKPGTQSPLSGKPGHHAAKAKACISLFMEGGPSHIDTFDPKPKLAELHMQEFTRQDKFASNMASGKRYYIQSPFGARQVGDSGLWMCDRFARGRRMAWGRRTRTCQHLSCCPKGRFRRGARRTGRTGFCRLIFRARRCGHPARRYLTWSRLMA
jgi:hypothetical protein